MKAKHRNKQSFETFALFLPGFLLFVFAVAVPFIMGLRVALTNWNGISQEMKYIGFKNFQLLLNDSSLGIVFKNSLQFAIMVTIFNNILSLSLALALNNKYRERNLLRTVFFLPTCLSTVLAAFIWSYICRDVFSQIFGIKSLLGNPRTVILGVVIISLWNSVGINIIIYLAGLASIPKDLYEAAIVDGANSWQKFRNVTIPMLMPSFTVCITLTLTSGLKEFGTTIAATGGGPGRSSEMISIYIYNNLYSYYQAGYGQALALMFVILLVSVGWILSRIFRSKEVEV